jgi:hypothetical protein
MVTNLYKARRPDVPPAESAPPDNGTLWAAFYMTSKDGGGVTRTGSKLGRPGVSPRRCGGRVYGGNGLAIIAANWYSLDQAVTSGRSIK